MTRIHASAFPDAVLSRLGPKVVRLHYASLFDGPHDLTALIARADAQPVGLLIGGVFRGSTVHFITQNWRPLALAAARRPRLLASPALSRFTLGLKLVLARRRTPGPERPLRVPEGSFGVLVLAVVPGAQGEGVGRTLLDAAAREAQAAGFTGMHLTTDPGSASARFYAAQGWAPRLEGDGRWEGLMTRPLPS
ncbi:MAG: GNAT family N-acetyltransferase [Iamia sp.]